MENTLLKDNKYAGLVRLGAMASMIQLLLVIAFTVVATKIGSRPETALEAFEAFSHGDLWGLLKDELLIIMMLSLYLFTFSALFFILKEERFTLVFLGALFTIVAIGLALSSQSAFSLMHLSHRYYAAVDEMTKLSILSAGEAVIASNMWNSTASFFSGILLQGGGVLMSLAMIGNKRFMKVTIISGILSNGLDLIQHLLHYTSPTAAEYILMVSGAFYLIWYIALSKDLYKFFRHHTKE